MLTGFLINSMIIVFFLPINYIFAIEYNAFTSKISGIEFQYPIDWDVEDSKQFKMSIAKEDDDYIKITNVANEIKIIDTNPGKNDDRYMYIHIYDEVEKQNLQSFTETNMKKELELYEESGWVTDIIKEPTLVKIGNLQTGMYILHVENVDSGDDEIAQRWTILKGNRGYAFEFSTQKNEFNSLENSEIRDHFIKSIKFHGDDTSAPTNKSGTTSETATSPNHTIPNSPTASTNTQNLNNLNQAQLVDLIATEISNANNIDKTTLILAIDDLSGKTKAKGGNVIDSLKKMAGIILKDPSGNVAKNIINAVNNVGLNQ